MSTDNENLASNRIRVLNIRLTISHTTICRFVNLLNSISKLMSQAYVDAVRMECRELCVETEVESCKKKVTIKLDTHYQLSISQNGVNIRKGTRSVCISKETLMEICDLKETILLCCSFVEH